MDAHGNAPVREPLPHPAMRPPRHLSPILLLPLAAAMLAACGGSPTSPGGSSGSGGAAQTRVDRAQITLGRLGEAAVVTASAGAGSTAAPAMELAAERRWLGERPVLDAAELAAGRIRASGPGTAVLRVSAFGAQPAEVTVQVRPARPLIVSAPAAAAGDGDVVELRGYAMDALRGAAIRVGDAAATVLGGDSATLRVSIPSAVPAGCASGTPREAVRADAADVAEGVAVTRKVRGALELAMGQARRLTTGEVACLRFGAAPGARYALAFLDTRQLARAQAGFEGTAPSPAAYTVTIAEAGRAAAAASRAPAYQRAPSGDRVRLESAAAPGNPRLRATPWAAGERFTVADPSLPSPLPARVVRVYGGHLVLAVADAPGAVSDAWIARADSAFGQLVRDGYPVLAAALGADRPVTSAGSGQLLVIARPDNSAYLGETVTGGDGSYIYLNSTHGATAAAVLRAAAHEATHAWQEQYAASLGMGGTGAAMWALEGTADLVAWATLRRSMGIALGANYEWAAALDDPARVSYALLAAGTRGDLTAGYTSAAAFLLDLSARMTRAGASEDDALAATVRGALEGWYGHDAFGGTHAGLSARMRGALGAGWEPADALLRWTLSQAVDDLADAPELQNPVFARASTAGQARGAGWLAPALLRAGATATREDAAGPAAVSGNAATITWRYGSPNYVRLDDDGIGGAYTLAATVPGVAWMIVRYR